MPFFHFSVGRPFFSLPGDRWQKIFETFGENKTQILFGMHQIGLMPGKFHFKTRVKFYMSCIKLD